MTDLATPQDLAQVMARDLTADEQTRASKLLAIASARVRTYTGRNFTQVTETVRLRVRDGRVRLPQSPVTAVSAVAVPAGTAIAFSWVAGEVVDCNPGTLNAFELEPFRTRLQWVDVTYTHGYTTVPADVVGIVCDIAASALSSPPEESGVQTETLGPFSTSYGSSYPGGVRLTQAQRDALGSYMTVGATASTT
jgi:hypothetical protein